MFEDARPVALDEVQVPSSQACAGTHAVTYKGCSLIDDRNRLVRCGVTISLLICLNKVLFRGLKELERNIHERYPVTGVIKRSSKNVFLPKN